MKLTVLLLVCSLGIAHAANSHAQTTDVHITAQNQTVKEVLQEIESQSGFGFSTTIRSLTWTVGSA